MNWLGFAIFAIFFYSIFDFFMKISSSRIHEGLGGFIMNFVSAIILLVYMIYIKLRGENIFAITKPGGIMYSVVAGVAIGLATIFLLKTFASGVNLSVGIPFVRIGIVLLASLLGILILKEGLTVRYLIGFTLSLSGLYLMIAK